MLLYPLDYTERNSRYVNTHISSLCNNDTFETMAHFVPIPTNGSSWVIQKHGCIKYRFELLSTDIDEAN